MKPVRCSMAACDRLGEHHEPDGGWFFCDPCFDIHLALRREDFARNAPPPVRRLDGRTSKALPCPSHAAYARHKAHGEQPCHPCVEEERIYQRERYARRKAS